MARKTLEERFWEKVAKGDGCWEWQGSCNSNGYGQIAKKKKRFGVHRVSWELANGEIPKGLFVLHHCDNPPCVNPDHLFLGTQQQNIDDMLQKGRFKGGGHPGTNAGEDNGQAKLTANDVMQIRQFCSENGHGSQRQAATKFKVSFQQISDICAYKCWRSVA